MADLRETLLANAKLALEVASVTVNAEETTKPSGLQAYRHRTRSLDLSALPDVGIYWDGERPAVRQELSSTGVSERTVRLAFVCRAKATATQTGDEALIPLLAWVELAMLAADYTVDGAAANAGDPEIDALEVTEHADTVAAALVRIPYTVRTKRWDPRQAP